MAFAKLHYDQYSDKQELLVVEKQQPEWISTTEAAELMGIALSSVSRLCRQGKINCRQFGEGHRSIWEVDKTSAIAYRDSDKPVGGRPRKEQPPNN